MLRDTASSRARACTHSRRMQPTPCCARLQQQPCHSSTSTISASSLPPTPRHVVNWDVCAPWTAACRGVLVLLLHHMACRQSTAARACRPQGTTRVPVQKNASASCLHHCSAHSHRALVHQSVAQPAAGIHSNKGRQPRPRAGHHAHAANSHVRTRDPGHMVRPRPHGDREASSAARVARQPTTHINATTHKSTTTLRSAAPARH